MLSFCDLHVHLGRASDQPVKITASPELTLDRAIEHAEKIRGLNVLGIIDAACNGVLKEFQGLVAKGYLGECPGGGLKTSSGFFAYPRFRMGNGHRRHSGSLFGIFPGDGRVRSL